MRSPFRFPGAVIVCVGAFWLGGDTRGYAQFNNLDLVQISKEAIKHLQKAIKAYPKFVSAHVNLGIAYLDQNDSERARSEFETATKLDDKFARSFLNLGVLSMSQKDFAGAASQLEKAATLRPRTSGFWRRWRGRKMQIISIDVPWRQCSGRTRSTIRNWPTCIMWVPPLPWRLTISRPWRANSPSL